MKEKKIALSIILLLSILITYIGSSIAYSNIALGSFETSIQKYKYQLSFSELYFTSDNSVKSVQTDNSDTSAQKTVYLTFDDGPSERTLEILDILDQYNIKATFFVLCNEDNKSADILKKVAEKGHSIGVHSASHSYTKIYKSVDSFLSDFEICHNYIQEVTGQNVGIFRFPGGSVNSYNKKICKELTDEMLRRGYLYFDWNVSSEDAVKGYTVDSIYKNVINGCKNKNSCVVLMHDSKNKKETVEALKSIIPALIEQGYVFDVLDEDVEPTVFKIK